jgi:stearoyl-CoA desaturase (delta-9 desaturase)
MLVKQDPATIGRADITDLNEDPLLRWQHRNYLWLALFWAFLFPSLACGWFWGDYRGGFFYAGVLRLVMVHHATFCVNSLAHTLGSTTFADDHSPRDSLITAIVTFGEGYHNFHHEFPSDYRNAIKFWQYDPTKWVIRFFAFFGLTYNLKYFPENEVQKGMIQMQQKKIDSKRNEIHWGPNLDELPVYSLEQVSTQFAATGKSWIVIGGFVHDVTDFIEDHPGGPKILATMIGKDGTKAFNGAIYNHSNAARNLLSSKVIGKVEGFTESELSKVKAKETVHFVEKQMLYRFELVCPT